MAVFAKYDGVDGEAKDSNHDKWIDVLAIDWGSHKPSGAVQPFELGVRTPGN